MTRPIEQARPVRNGTSKLMDSPVVPTLMLAGASSVLGLNSDVVRPALHAPLREDTAAVLRSGDWVSRRQLPHLSFPQSTQEKTVSPKYTAGVIR